METIDMITQVTMMVLYDDFASVCAPHVILIFEQNSLGWLAAEWLLRLPQVFQGSQARRAAANDGNFHDRRFCEGGPAQLHVSCFTARSSIK